MSHDQLRPESLMMSYGYKPSLSEGAIKCPIFQTSTFVFSNAMEGKRFFEVAYGLREKEKDEELGLIYSRLNNPDLEILENRLCLWDGAEDCAVFESGMSAISTAMLEFMKPGDLLLYSKPVYGGTDHFINHFLKKLNIESVGFRAGETKEEMLQTMDDLLEHGCDVLTIGQYLQPTKRHIAIAEYVHPDVFAEYKEIGLAKGFDYVESGPMVRSSYHAERHVFPNR